jgi:hypothetical protein
MIVGIIVSLLIAFLILSLLANIGSNGKSKRPPCPPGKTEDEWMWECTFRDNMSENIEYAIKKYNVHKNIKELEYEIETIKARYMNKICESDMQLIVDKAKSLFL